MGMFDLNPLLPCGGVLTCIRYHTGQHIAHEARALMNAGYRPHLCLLFCFAWRILHGCLTLLEQQRLEHVLGSSHQPCTRAPLGPQYRVSWRRSLLDRFPLTLCLVVLVVGVFLHSHDSLSFVLRAIRSSLCARVSKRSRGPHSRYNDIFL
jgi:hypothetical protein